MPVSRRRMNDEISGEQNENASTDSSCRRKFGQKNEGKRHSRQGFDITKDRRVLRHDLANALKYSSGASVECRAHLSSGEGWHAGKMMIRENGKRRSNGHDSDPEQYNDSLMVHQHLAELSGYDDQERISNARHGPGDNARPYAPLPVGARRLTARSHHSRDRQRKRDQGYPLETLRYQKRRKQRNENRRGIMRKDGIRYGRMSKGIEIGKVIDDRRKGEGS